MHFYSCLHAHDVWNGWFVIFDFVSVDFSLQDVQCCCCYCLNYNLDLISLVRPLQEWSHWRGQQTKVKWINTIKTRLVLCVCIQSAISVLSASLRGMCVMGGGGVTWSFQVLPGHWLGVGDRFDGSSLVNSWRFEDGVWGEQGPL